MDRKLLVETIEADLVLNMAAFPACPTDTAGATSPFGASLMIVVPVPWILLQSLKLDTRMSPLVISWRVGKLGSTNATP